MATFTPEQRRYLRNRLRLPPTASTVKGALPILFFGQLSAARAATIGLNPSDREYVDKSGKELDGPERRLHTLGSLGATSRASLTDGLADAALELMLAYFRPGGPHYKWFDPLALVLAGLGCSYADGSASHLDLVQEATSPRWSDLQARFPGQARHLLSRDLPCLSWELSSFPVVLLVCNGKGEGPSARPRRPTFTHRQDRSPSAPSAPCSRGRTVPPGGSATHP